MLIGEAANVDYKVFGMIRPEFELRAMAFNASMLTATPPERFVPLMPERDNLNNS